MLVCLSEGDLEGNLLGRGHGDVVGEGTTSLSVGEAEASELDGHVDNIASTEHEGAEVISVVILERETLGVLVEHLRYNGLEVGLRVVDEGLDETEGEVTRGSGINRATSYEVSLGHRGTGLVNAVLDGGIIGDSNSGGRVTEEVHGDVTDEEVTDGGVTLVLFTISRCGVGTEDRGSINTSNTVNPSGRLSE